MYMQTVIKLQNTWCKTDKTEREIKKLTNANRYFHIPPKKLIEIYTENQVLLYRGLGNHHELIWLSLFIYKIPFNQQLQKTNTFQVYMNKSTMYTGISHRHWLTNLKYYI